MFKYITQLLDWCKIVLRLRNKKSGLLFKEAEIWWCHVGFNIGVEVFGKGDNFARPVLIFKKLNSHSFLGIPLTSQQKEGSWYIPIRCDDTEGKAILSQVKILDRSRLMQRIEAIPRSEFIRIQKAFKAFYCPDILNIDDTQEKFSPASGEAGDGG
jgi:mRNA-degrading endonuclease toxin of MazEF toxin-antitoxin module